MLFRIPRVTVLKITSVTFVIPDAHEVVLLKKCYNFPRVLKLGERNPLTKEPIPQPAVKRMQWKQKHENKFVGLKKNMAIVSL